MRAGLPAGTALDMGVAFKAFDAYEQSLIRDAIALRLDRRLAGGELFDE